MAGFWRTQRRTVKKPEGTLCRLVRDRRGNVLALVAVCSLPIAGFIGSGLDVSRAYLVRTRLQQACDAGVLAGRKVMGAGGSLNTGVKSEISKFVDFNFPRGTINTSPVTVDPTHDPTTDTINLGLSTKMDTAVMNLFGIDTVPIAVNCSARDDYANIDIVLVLDTTGSMACSPSRNETSCSNFVNGRDRTTIVDGRAVKYYMEETSGFTNISRMQGLRDAVSSLQTQMATIEAQFDTATAGSRKRIRWSIVPFSQMVNAGRSKDSTGNTLWTRNKGWFNTEGVYAENCSPARCNGSTTTPHSDLWMKNDWDGCIEERQTSNMITPGSNWRIPDNLPATAYDLMFDLAPTSVGTRWTVADPSIEPDSQYACPKAMRELAPMSTSDFNSYFQPGNGFLANGGTYLDIGMLWAARLLSRNGLWKSDNPVTYNGFPVRRYVIFMTDGYQQSGFSGGRSTGYAAYAQEHYFRRVSTDGMADTNDPNHLQRLQMTCTAIKNMEVEIYAISFGAGSTLSGPMAGCSSGAGYGYKADNAAQLNQVFKTIGNDIGSLRLSR
jgi:Flp pilus assembly protein TadG